MASYAYDAILVEAKAVRTVAERIQVGQAAFDFAVELLRPVVGFIGIGKSGHVARRAAASFSSVGLAAMYVDANEALHGDLGALRACSTIVALSNSGTTSEVLRTLALCDEPDNIIAIVG